MGRFDSKLRRGPGRRNSWRPSNSRRRSPDQAFQKRIILEALSGITKITPLIHRSRYSGNYTFEDLKNLENPYIGGKGLRRSRLPNYRKFAFIQLPDGNRLTVYYNPKNPYMPKSIIVVHNSTPELLFQIEEALPGLKIMDVEYAIDFHCRTNNDAENLLYLLRRYMFFPKAKRTSMAGGKFAGWKEPRRTNAVYYIHSVIRAKVYERGDDNKRLKGDKGWLHKNVDRVRLEFTLPRRSGLLQRNGLDTLPDLFISPKFHQIFSGKIFFKNFGGSPRLPRDWEDYTSEDEEGNQESFQEEFLQAKTRKVKNVNQYLEDNPQLEGFKKIIKTALSEFDQHWEEKGKSIREKAIIYTSII